MKPSEQEILNILETLVAFPTVSCDSNLALIEWVERYLDTHDVPHWRIDAKEHKSSLIARIGPDAPGGIVLSGHTDVVPVAGQPWVTDPFTLVTDDEKIYGRGTSDMKAFVALALAHVPYFLAQKLTKPIWLAFSHDEEIGCLGAAAVAEAVIAANAQPSLVVIGEPTMMKLIGAHKGIHSFETIITGHEAHSSMPEQGANAVMLMGELIVTLNEIATQARDTKDADFAAVTPYASVHVGVIEGGTARNIIPRHCRIAWEVRPLPATDVDVLLAPFYARAAALETQMKTIDAQCRIVTNRLTNVRGLQKQENAPHLALACKLANTNSADSVAFGTEGGIMQGYGLPVIICGPGSIDQAHQPNEFLSREQLALGAEFMLRVAEACV